MIFNFIKSDINLLTQFLIVNKNLNKQLKLI